MPQEYLPIDETLRTQAIIRLNTNTGGGGSARNSSPGSIKFQFPPKISSDSKGIEWQEKALKGEEMFALYEGALSREMKIEWSYIIDGSAWSAQTIGTQVQNIRKYFYASIGTELVAELKIYDVIGFQAEIGQMTFRIMNIDISHDGPIIQDGGVSFHLRTNCSMTAKSWVQVKEEGGDEPAQEMKALVERVPDQGWF